MIISKQRIAKIIARSGVCSRRDAEGMIAQGRIALHLPGKTPSPITNPATTLTQEEGRHIYLDGKRIPEAGASRIWMFHKPTGYITSRRDPQGRPTIYDILPGEMRALITIGRLDMNTQGLLLLTNDGELARRMELPSTGLKRQYRVRAYAGKVSDDVRMKMQSLSGCDIPITPRGGRKSEIYHIDEIKFDEAGKARDNKNIWLNITLSEGKNREVRNICAHFGLEVNRLIRLSYGPYSLGNLKTGEVQQL